MKIIIFEHLKEDITLLAERNQQFLEDVWKKLNCSSLNPFPSNPYVAKDAC